MRIEKLVPSQRIQGRWLCTLDDGTLLRQKLKGRAPDEKELKRASDALARRGYRWEEIKAALRRYGADIEED